MHQRLKEAKAAAADITAESEGWVLFFTQDPRLAAYSQATRDWIDSVAMHAERLQTFVARPPSPGHIHRYQAGWSRVLPHKTWPTTGPRERADA